MLQALCKPQSLGAFHLSALSLSCKQEKMVKERKNEERMKKEERRKKTERQKEEERRKKLETNLDSSMKISFVSISSAALILSAASCNIFEGYLSFTSAGFKGN